MKKVVRAVDWHGNSRYVVANTDHPTVRVTWLVHVDRAMVHPRDFPPDVNIKHEIILHPTGFRDQANIEVYCPSVGGQLGWQGPLRPVKRPPLDEWDRQAHNELDWLERNHIRDLDSRVTGVAPEWHEEYFDDDNET